MRSWEIEVIDFIFNFTLNKNKKMVRDWHEINFQ